MSVATRSLRRLRPTRLHSFNAFCFRHLGRVSDRGCLDDRDAGPDIQLALQRKARGESGVTYSCRVRCFPASSTSMWMSGILAQSGHRRPWLPSGTTWHRGRRCDVSPAAGVRHRPGMRSRAFFPSFGIVWSSFGASNPCVYDTAHGAVLAIRIEWQHFQYGCCAATSRQLRKRTFPW